MNTETLNTYKMFMQSIAARVLTIGKMIRLGNDFDGKILEEVCHLQVRFMCEYLAVACLVAHGDSSYLNSTDAHSRYEADKIFKLIGKLEPQCFPRAGSLTQDGGNKNLVVLEDQPLLVRDLRNMYTRSSDHLHLGSLKKLIKAKELEIDTPQYFDEIARRFAKLTSCHTIYMADYDAMVLCTLISSNGDFPEFQISFLEPQMNMDASK